MWITRKQSIPRLMSGSSLEDNSMLDVRKLYSNSLERRFGSVRSRYRKQH